MGCLGQSNDSMQFSVEGVQKSRAECFSMRKMPIKSVVNVLWECVSIDYTLFVFSFQSKQSFLITFFYNLVMIDYLNISFWKKHFVQDCVGYYQLGKNNKKQKQKIRIKTSSKLTLGRFLKVLGEIFTLLHFRREEI